MIRWKQHYRQFWHPVGIWIIYSIYVHDFLIRPTEPVYGYLWNSVWPGSMRREAGGAVLLHPVCSDPSRLNEDRQTAKNGEGSLVPLLAWVAASKKKPRRKASQLAPALRSHLSGRTQWAWPGFDSAKVSWFDVCVWWASQPTLDSDWLSAGSSHFQC